MPLVAHGDPVVDADGVELEGHAAGLADLVLRDPPVLCRKKWPGMMSTWLFAIADERLVEVGVGEAGRAEQAAVGGPLEPLLDRYRCASSRLSATRDREVKFARGGGGRPPARAARGGD